MLKSRLSWLIAVLFALTLAACGGGARDTAPINPNAPNPPPTATPPTANVLTGIFVDAPVEGLTYVSGAQSAVTDAAGTFKFVQGDTVQFKVGNVVLGKATGKALMTPLDLVQAVDATATANDPRVVQITQFLMTVDASPTATKMTILAGTAATAQNEALVDLSQAPVSVTAILSRIVPTKTPVTAAAAAAHIQGTIAALTSTNKAGAFAAVDSTATPTLGLRINVVSNLAGNGFDVTGVAASTSGATWNIAGTMTTDGSLQAVGTGTGVTPPTIMVITGAMTAATQLTATANFSLNGVANQVPVIFEKAVIPAISGTFGLPGDAGVVVVPGDMVHVGADMTINPDGTVRAHVVRGQVTGIVALAAIYSNHFAGLSGVVTSAGNIIAIGGTTDAGPDAGGSLHISGKAITNPAPVTIFTGSLAVAGTAAITMTATDLNAGTPAATALSFAKTANTLVGAYQGTHSDAAGLPSTFTFAVNNDNSVHGFTLFLKPIAAGVKQSPFLIDGTVTPATGALAQPPGFNLGVLGGAVAAFPGLVMFDQEGLTKFTPGTFAGKIAAGATSGTWQTGPVLATGTFTGILLP